MKRLKCSGPMPDILPATMVASVINDARHEWLSQKKQKQSFEELVKHGFTHDKANRTMASRFRSMVQQTYGGHLWFQVLISIGTIPLRMIELANLQLGQQALEQKRKAPASSREPASAGKPTGSQHRVSVPKRQRQKATKILRAVSEETEKRSSYYGNRTERMSDEEFAKLQGQAERAFKRASDGSQASGHAYKLDGQAYGAPETSNFAILLADFCGEHNINVATGVREVSNRPATLRKR